MWCVWAVYYKWTLPVHFLYRNPMQLFLIGTDFCLFTFLLIEIKTCLFFKNPCAEDFPLAQERFLVLERLVLSGEIPFTAHKEKFGIFSPKKKR